MKDLIDQNNLIKPAQTGKITEGKVIGKAKSAIFLDLGPIGTGIIYGKEFQKAKDEIRELKTGASVFAKITGLENEDGYIELSLNQASDELNWEKLKEHKEKNETLKIKILGANKGGLTANVYGILAFLPVSQLLPENYPRVEKGETSKIVQELQKFIGEEMGVRVFALDSREKKLILSEKAKDDEKIKQEIKNYNIGDIVDGEISGMTNFGAFVKINNKKSNLEGLIHISELDWQKIDDPADIVKVGQKVKVKIVSISGDKISLSLKALKQDPWQDIEKEYKKDDIFKKKVTKFNPFGAFVEITPKIQGLCHISEFGTKEKMEQALEIGKEYKFQIISIDSKERRVSLRVIEK